MRKWLNFFKESKAELQAVHWPTKDEATRASLAVIFFAAFFSLFLFAVDYVANLFVLGLVR